MIYVSSGLFIMEVNRKYKKQSHKKNHAALHWKWAVLFEQNYFEIEVSGKLLAE